MSRASLARVIQRVKADPLTARHTGAFSIPICLDYKKAASNIKNDKYTDGAPCGDESDYEVPVVESISSAVTGGIQDAIDKLKEKENGD